MIRSFNRGSTNAALKNCRERTQELFHNVRLLFDMIKAQYEEDKRTPEEMIGTQMATFVVYTCGHMATYLYRFPQCRPYEYSFPSSKSARNTDIVTDSAPTRRPVSARTGQDPQRRPDDVRKDHVHPESVHCFLARGIRVATIAEEVV
jgi:hypothetical protein